MAPMISYLCAQINESVACTSQYYTFGKHIWNVFIDGSMLFNVLAAWLCTLRSRNDLSCTVKSMDATTPICFSNLINGARTYLLSTVSSMRPKMSRLNKEFKSAHLFLLLQSQWDCMAVGKLCTVKKRPSVFTCFLIVPPEFSKRRNITPELQPRTFRLASIARPIWKVCWKMLLGLNHYLIRAPKIEFTLCKSK
jgi:hypothetical protein